MRPISDSFAALFPDTRVGQRLLSSVRLATCVAGLATLSLGVGGCTQAQLDGQSPAYLVIDKLLGASGTSPSTFGTPLSSDVLDATRGVFEDLGQVVFRLALRDPGGTNSPTTPSPANYITVTRYHVSYSRTDGRNTPGVDVPYPYDGAMTLTVPASGASGTLSLVRLQGKLEAPLIGLRDGGGAIAISTIAQVTFYGEDQAGRAVSVSGLISINFADWADPE